MDLGFTHVHAAPGAGSTRTLLLLHGTGGNERDLLPLARSLDAQAGVLSPRGKVLENGLPRFFRRIREGVFDLEDLRVRTLELAEFIERACGHYAIDPASLVAVGFSNGANIAGNVLLLRPGLLTAALLLRPMTLPRPGLRADALATTRVLISSGSSDSISPPKLARELAQMLGEFGAAVRLEIDDGGHALTGAAIDAGRSWLAGG